MTKYRINADGPSIAIELTEVGGNQERLLEAFAECQDGRCSCPTNEYEKVAAMDVQPDEDRIAIKLQAKPGTTFDAAEIVACLNYTVAKSQP
jgi:hypothetical protein